MMSVADHRVAVEDLRAFAQAALRAAGVPEADATVAAGAIVESDLSGADGHGVFRLPQYVRRIRAGGINLAPTMQIRQGGPSAALLDGDNGLGHLVMTRATALATTMAAETGAAWVGVRRSNHAGAASVWASAMLPHDMIGIYVAVGNANHLAPWGGIDRLLSTNPIAIAVPAQEEPPVVLDMATTVAAYGKVKLAAQRGEAMPEGWMIDKQGRPMTDPLQAEEGLLLPAGGYKGYALAFLFGLLAGTLNEAAFGADTIDFNADDVTATNTGQAVIALSIARLGDVSAFKRRVDAVVRQMRASATLPGVEQVRVPGDGRHRYREDRLRHGVPIPPGLAASLNKLAGQLGIGRLTD